MRLKQINLKNFRGFKKFKMDLDSRTNVIIGQNGAGKTTILDSIAICFTHLTGNLSSSNEGYNIDAWFTSQDITNGENDGKCEIIVQDPSINDNQPFKIEVTKQRDQKGLSFDKAPEQCLKTIKDKLKTNQILSIPIIAYYNVHRTYPLNEDLKEPKKVYNKLLFAYEKSLVLRSPSFKKFEKWFQQQVIEDNAYKVKNKDLNLELPSLKNIRNALDKFLSIIQPDTFGSIQSTSESTTFIDFDVTTKQNLIIEKSGKEILFNQLSDGERMIVGLVAEITRRLILANEKDPINGTGIVLIDEIELHLHPNWQRRIIQALEGTFPNVMFILTTHSPLVLSSLRRSSIKVISNSQSVPTEELPDIYTGTSDEILERLMLSQDSYNPYKNKISEIDKLFNEMKFDLAKEKLKQIKSELNSNPEWIKDYEERIEFARS